MSESILGRLKAAAANSLDWAKETAQSGIKLAEEKLGLSENKDDAKADAKPQDKSPDTKAQDAKAQDAKAQNSKGTDQGDGKDKTLAAKEVKPEAAEAPESKKEETSWASKAWSFLSTVSDYVPTLAAAKAIVRTGVKIYEDTITGNTITINDEKSLSINKYLASKGYSGAAAFLTAQTAVSKVDSKPNKLFDLDTKCFKNALDEQAKIYECKIKQGDSQKQAPNCSSTLGKLSAEEWATVINKVSAAEKELPKVAVQADGSLDFAAFAKGAIENLQNKTRVTESGAVHVNAESKIVTIKEGDVVGFLDMEKKSQLIADVKTGDRVIKVDGQEKAHRRPDGTIEVKLSTGGSVIKIGDKLQLVDEKGKNIGDPVSIGETAKMIATVKGTDYVAEVLPGDIQESWNASHDNPQAPRKPDGKKIEVRDNGLSMTDNDGTVVFLKNNGEVMMDLPIGCTLIRSALGKYYVIEKGQKGLKEVTKEEISQVDGEAKEQLQKALSMLEGLGEGARVLSLNNGAELSFVHGMVQALLPTDSGEKAKVTTGSQETHEPPKPKIESQGTTQTFDTAKRTTTIEGPKGTQTIDFKTGTVWNDKVEVTPDNRIVNHLTGDVIEANGEVKLADGTHLDNKGDVHFTDGTVFHKDGTVTQNGKLLTSDGAKEFAEKQAQTVISSAEAISAAVVRKCQGNNISLGDIAMIEAGLGQVSSLLNLLMAIGDGPAIARLLNTQASLEGALNTARASFAASTVLRAQKRDLFQESQNQMIDPVKRFQARYTADHIPV